MTATGRQEDHRAVAEVPAGHLDEPEHIAVERQRPFEVGDLQYHVADALDLDSHHVTPTATLPSGIQAH